MAHCFTSFWPSYLGIAPQGGSACRKAVSKLLMLRLPMFHPMRISRGCKLNPIGYKFICLYPPQSICGCWCNFRVASYHRSRLVRVQTTICYKVPICMVGGICHSETSSSVVTYFLIIILCVSKWTWFSRFHVKCVGVFYQLFILFELSHVFHPVVTDVTPTLGLKVSFFRLWWHRSCSPDFGCTVTNMSKNYRPNVRNSSDPHCFYRRDAQVQPFHHGRVAERDDTCVDSSFYAVPNRFRDTELSQRSRGPITSLSPGCSSMLTDSSRGAKVVMSSMWLMRASPQGMIPPLSNGDDLGKSSVIAAVYFRVSLTSAPKWRKSGVQTFAGSSRDRKLFSFRYKTLPVFLTTSNSIKTLTTSTTVDISA